MKIPAFLCLLPLPLLAGQYSLQLSPNSSHVFLELEVPAGSRVTHISHGGSYDESRGKIKWGPLLPAPANVQFALAEEPEGIDLSTSGQPPSLIITASGPTQADEDGDGLPDTFESQFGFDPDTPDGSEDTDGDGLSNRAEFLLGTNPRDPRDHLTTHSLEPGNQQWTVSPALPPGAILETSTTLSASGWVAVDSNLESEGNTTTISLPAMNAPSPRRFFRLRLAPDLD
ncbi:hypothetical protein HNR46_002016 [Haloferula luteola]|uniref:Uncharacterized protein n=1 Tax=Haloferula luteola TaxID=595692 RepID=A0A840V086_9BACT|nr:thrombospondin type 3 repeat-containing protein [Haloferula luteola]MBB5351777.1 hypothetical protein [Haloferula luteola]